jgi:hypothetical protein
VTSVGARGTESNGASHGLSTASISSDHERSKMRRFATGILIVTALTVFTSCFIEGPVPYTYSATYCSGCWNGTWEGREGWHYGGGRPWDREHHEGDHQGEGHRGEGDRHEGHR